MSREAPAKEKICAACGRRMKWRKKWAKNWDDVKYCSDACRRDAGSSISKTLETSILNLLDARADDATICPSEAARSVDAERWRGLMEPARRAARRLAHRGQVRIMQNGRMVDPEDFRGPIRIGHCAAMTLPLALPPQNCRAKVRACSTDPEQLHQPTL